MTFIATLPLNDEYSTEDFVGFGGVNENYHYQDGLRAGGVILIPRWLHKQLGSPGELVTAFDSNEFDAIPRDITGTVGSYDFPVPPGSEDRLYWYKMQHNHVWYRVLACCRSCATQKLHAAVFGMKGSSNEVVRDGYEGQVGA